MVSVCNATLFAAAFNWIAGIAKASMSFATVNAAPAFAAAIATRPEPLARSSTRLPRTRSGLSRT
jgi:hypothetical protein